MYINSFTVIVKMYIFVANGQNIERHTSIKKEKCVFSKSTFEKKNYAKQPHSTKPLSYSRQQPIIKSPLVLDY